MVRPSDTINAARALTEDLAESRERTLKLIAPFDDGVLRGQHDALMSPLVWDVAHVANYEDQWLVRALGGPTIREGIDDIYDAFKHRRDERDALPMLTPSEARAYGGTVRVHALERLAAADLHPDGANPLLRRGFVYDMVVKHEHQHAETLLASIQLLPPAEARRLQSVAAPTGIAPDETEVRVAAGSFLMGADDPCSYDNERPRHVVDLPAFWIDTAPVTNGEFEAFIVDGGYQTERWWQPAGWAWRQDTAAVAPQFWERDGSDWQRWRFGQRDGLRSAEPVQHVCWYEADAYARWAGRRLPTEAEWEKAAAGASADPTQVNLGQRYLGPAEVGAFPAGVSNYGAHQMLGDVWEWTASDFRVYPDFVAFPYREYSEVFNDEGYKVLRGGSWATHPRAISVTFRNWDWPMRRQIFAGFRCARDDT